jgi:hypothetical protein
LFDLGEEIHRDISGMSFGFDLPGEVMAGVLFASGTAAAWIAAPTADNDQASSQQRTFGLELLLTSLKEAADQGGMFRYFHTNELVHGN